MNISLNDNQSTPCDYRRAIHFRRLRTMAVFILAILDALKNNLTPAVMEAMKIIIDGYKSHPPLYNIFYQHMKGLV